jgi:ssRNA-specific RNase YbeY (16S rRNA maturation enzyme)
MIIGGGEVVVILEGNREQGTGNREYRNRPTNTGVLTLSCQPRVF